MTKRVKPFYEIYDCPNCNTKYEICTCELNYCPFCTEKFGFTQDWNIHILNKHQVKEFTQEQYDECLESFDSLFPKSNKTFTEKLLEMTSKEKSS